MGAKGKRWPPRAWLPLVGLVALVGCTESHALGTRCRFDSDCDAFLACRMGRCRVECRLPRDCRAGEACLADEAGVGACQVPEDECDSDRRCASPLVCRAGLCTNECRGTRDCPAGLLCTAAGDGARGCTRPAGACAVDSDCDAPLVCGPDAVCRAECQTDRDCRYGSYCDLAGVCVAPMLTTVIAPGRHHTCAITDDGVLACAGAGYGSSLVRFEGLPPLVSVATNEDHYVCVLDRDGAIRCLGREPGAPLEGWPPRRSVADPGVLDPTLPPALEVEGGSMFFCSRHDDDVVRCWGRNGSGQLGDGTTEPHDTPTPVAGIDDPVDLSVGFVHACVLRAGGTVECWGDNGNGQLGDGTRDARSTPTPVPGIDDATALGTGWTHTCVARASGTVSCFGSDNDDRIRAADAALDRVVEVAGRDGGTCARRDDGSVWCWFGGPPEQRREIVRAVQLGGANWHFCARRATGHAYCWGVGNAAAGSLANGTGLDSEVPIVVR